MFLGLGAFAGGLAQSTGFSAAGPLAVHIAASETSGSPLSRGAFDRVDLDWWATARGPVLAQARAVGAWSDASALSDLLWLPVGILPAAVLIAIVAPRLRGPTLVRIGIAVMGLAGACLIAYYVDSYRAFGWEYAITLAEWECGLSFGAAAFVAGVATSLAALVLARPMARRVVLWIGRGRVGGQLVFLWTADGLAVPAGTV